MSTKLSETKIREICDLLVEGKPLSYISKTLEVSLTSIQCILNRSRHGDISSQYDFSKRKFVNNKRRLANEKLIQVCELLMQNKTFSEISKETGISYPYVQDIYHKKACKDITRNYDFSGYTGKKR